MGPLGLQALLTALAWVLLCVPGETVEDVVWQGENKATILPDPLECSALDADAEAEAENGWCAAEVEAGNAVEAEAGFWRCGGFVLLSLVEGRLLFEALHPRALAVREAIHQIVAPVVHASRGQTESGPDEVFESIIACVLLAVGLFTAAWAQRLVLGEGCAHAVAEDVASSSFVILSVVIWLWHGRVNTSPGSDATLISFLRISWLGLAAWGVKQNNLFCVLLYAVEGCLLFEGLFGATRPTLVDRLVESDAASNALQPACYSLLGCSPWR